MPNITPSEPMTFSELPAELRSTVEQVLPRATWTPITRVVDDPLPVRVDTGEEVLPADVDPTRQQLFGMVVADPSVLEQLNLPRRMRGILAETGIITTSPWIPDRARLQTPDGFVDIDLSASLEVLGFAGPRLIESELDERQVSEFYATNGQLFADSWRFGVLFVSPEFVRKYDLATGIGSYLIENPVDLTSDQRDEINGLQSFGYGPDAFTPAASARGYEALAETGESFWYPSFDSPQNSVPWALIQAAVALASLLMVLLVVAIGLSLAATESRDERDVLHAVGAAPLALRQVGAAKAWVLATGAAIVAVPAGYITSFVITRATDNTAPVPFGVIGALLVVIPLLAAGATLATSAIAQRFRPVTYSTFVAD
jgi:hypothetical protein